MPRPAKIALGILIGYVALIVAFERDEAELLVRGDLELIEALTDAAHSLTLRWLTNSMLALYRGFLEARSDLWVRTESFPSYLRDLVASIEAGDPETAITLTRGYYQHVDTRLAQLLRPLMPPATDTDPRGDDDAPGGGHDRRLVGVGREGRVLLELRL